MEINQENKINHNIKITYDMEINHNVEVLICHPVLTTLENEDKEKLGYEIYIHVNQYTREG